MRNNHARQIEYIILLKVRNESWTFETVIANRSVGFSSDVTGWYYEASLEIKVLIV